MRTKLFCKGKSTKWQPYRKLPEAKLLKELEARVGIEPTHKGFAVLVAESKLLTNMGISVGRSASKLLFFAPFCRLLAAKWQPDRKSREAKLLKGFGGAGRDRTGA